MRVRVRVRLTLRLRVRFRVRVRVRVQGQGGGYDSAAYYLIKPITTRHVEIGLCEVGIGLG